jgi:hypothetical protein
MSQILKPKCFGKSALPCEKTFNPEYECEHYDECQDVFLEWLIETPIEELDRAFTEVHGGQEE